MAWAYKARMCSYPAKALTIAGVTGTNGKTTTSYLVQAAVEAAGVRRRGVRDGSTGVASGVIGSDIVRKDHPSPGFPQQGDPRAR